MDKQEKIIKQYTEKLKILLLQDKTNIDLDPSETELMLQAKIEMLKERIKGIDEEKYIENFVSLVEEMGKVAKVNKNWYKSTEQLEADLKQEYEKNKKNGNFQFASFGEFKREYMDEKIEFHKKYNFEKIFKKLF